MAELENKEEQASLENENKVEEVKSNKSSKDSKKSSNNKNKSKKDEEQRSRILEYLKEEHKWENYVLLFLSLFALVLGCLILNNTLTVNETFPIIGNFPKAFAITLVVLAALALLLSLYPFFKPAFPEFKKIKWPRAKVFLADTVRVFTFLIILVLLFLLYDAFISKLIGLLLNL